MTSSITSLSEHFLHRFSVSKNTTILCSFSGGSDSTFLLNFLNKMRDEVGFKLIAFYLNHNLRGEESAEEEKSVFSTISRLSVPTIFYSKDIAQISKKRKTSTELCGREIRREIIKKLIKTFELDYVCTGHHRDDRVETYLFNTFRGSGLHGLTTLKEQDGKYIRPLLNLSKNEIVEFLKEEKISFCEDATNQESEYRRNRIRNIIIPAVKEQINPALEKTINRNIAVLEEYETTVNRLVTVFIDRYVKTVGNYVYISSEMKNDPFFTPLIIKEVFRQTLRDMKSPERNLSFINFEHVLEFFLREKNKSLRLPVPGGVNAFFDAKGMVLVFHNDFERLENYNYVLSSLESTIEEPYFSLSLKPFTGEPKQTFPLTFPILVRGRKAGDRVSIGGLQSEKKVKEILIDRKIPPHEKVFHPIIELPNGHRFLAGIGMEGFAFELNAKHYTFHYERKH